ncbi:MAG: penicillin acylase family protein [archaeon]|nr:penicillin acylase family protein [archaeon]
MNAPPSWGKGSLEYLLLIAGAILVAATIMLFLMSGHIDPVGLIYIPRAGDTIQDDPLGLPLGGPVGTELKIIRDQFGVPHVFAATDYSAFYGMGYAAAEDRLYQMHRTRMVMKGRLAELNGNMNEGATINLDKEMRRLQFADYAAARYPNLDVETRDFLQAYADGVNWYIETHKTSLHKLFNSVPEPWTPVDSLLVWDSVVRVGVDASEVTNLHTFEQKVVELGSVDAAAADMEPTAYVDSDGAVVQQSDVPSSTLQAMRSYANQHPPFGGYSTNLIEVPKMSHAWVVGGSRSTTGAAILVSSPQLDVTSPSPFHEIHVKGATFDVRGVAIPGAPGIYVGFNPRVAWGVTAAGGDLSDVFKLKMVGGDQYEYDGQTYTIESRTETILVKNGNPQTVTVKKTILGPVVTDMVSASLGEEYVLQAVPLVDSDIHTIQSLIAMMRADDVFQFRDALAKYRSPAVHIIFGDSQGNIGYWHLAAVPTRSSLSPLAGMVALDGSNSQFLWQGFIPHTLRPHVINPSSGILFSANNLSAGAWYPIFYNPGWGGGGDTARSYRLRELLLENHPAKFTPSEVLDIHFDDVSIFRRDLIEIALYIRERPGAIQFSPEAMSALTHLEEWYNEGAHSSIFHPYFALVSNFRSRLRPPDSQWITDIYGGGEPGMRAWLRHAKLVMTKGEDFENEEIAFLEKKLSDAWNNTVLPPPQGYGDTPSQWSSQIMNNQTNYSVEYFNTVFFGFGSLDPSKDETYTGWKNPDIGTLGGQLTQSYSLFVDLSQPDNSRSLLPLGNSEDPSNAHFNDLASRWMDADFYPAPISEDRLQSLIESITTLYYIR